MNARYPTPPHLLRALMAVAVLAFCAWPAIETSTIPLKPNETLLRVLPRVQGGAYAIVGTPTGTGLWYGTDAFVDRLIPRGRVVSDDIPGDHDGSATDGRILGGSQLQILRLDAMNRELARIVVDESPRTFFRDAEVDSDGSLVLLGNTTNRNFPVVNPLLPLSIPQGGEDTYERWAFLLKTDASGTAIATSTLIGGVANDEPGFGTGTVAYDLARDSAGNLYVAGSTAHVDFPTTANAYKKDPEFDEPLKRSEGFLLKVDRRLRSLLFSTFIGSDAPFLRPCPPGGTCPPPTIDNVAYAVVVAARQQPWVMLGTVGEALPASDGAYSAEPSAGYAGTSSLVRLDAQGSALVTSAFLGANAVPKFGAGPSLILQPDGSLVAFTYPIPGGDDSPDAVTARKLDADAHSLLESITFTSTASLSPVAGVAAPDGTVWITGRFFPADESRPGFEGIAPRFDLGNDFALQISGVDLRPAQLMLIPDLMAVGGLRASSYGAELSSIRGSITTLPSVGALGPALVAARNSTRTELQTSVSPYEFIQIVGVGLDLPVGRTPEFDRNGRLPTVLEGVRVTLDGVAAPLLSITSNSVTFTAPETLAARDEGSLIHLALERGGIVIGRLELMAARANPKASLVAGPNLSPSAVALHEDGTLNSPENPAKEGQTVAFFLNGGGAPATAVPAGTRVNTAMPWSQLESTVFAVSIGGKQSGEPATWQVSYFGSAPGLVAGTMQMNVKIPEGALGSMTEAGVSVKAELFVSFVEAWNGELLPLQHYFDTFSIYVQR